MRPSAVEHARGRGRVRRPASPSTWPAGRAAAAVLAGALVAGPLATGAAADAASCDPAAVRWASSSNTLYVTGPVTCTLADLDAASSAPITVVDPSAGVWHVGANIRLQEGATLQLHGSPVGGDANEVRLRSNNTTAADAVVEIRADWGTISIRSTRVTSWDDAVAGPDTEHATYRRAFIRARSSLDSSGVPRESRMDVVDSDVGHLGYHGSEAYGLSWKVNGSAPDIFDRVDVFGDVVGSRLHHNYMGLYTFGAYGMQILDNEVDNNVAYGLDPHDDSDALLIEGNHSHHNGNHGIICSKRCDHLVIRGNRSEANAGNGIMLHRQVTDTLVESNVAVANADSGIALFDSSGNTVRDNELVGNRRGIRLSVGSSSNVVEGNRIADSTDYGLYFYKGSDAPTAGDGRPRDNSFAGNAITGSGSYAIRLSEADGNTFRSTTFSANRRGLRFDQGVGNSIVASDLGGATVEVYGLGAPSDLALEGFGTATLKVDEWGRHRLVDAAGAVFDPDETLATTVSTGGSELILDAAAITTTSTVATLPLWVVPDAGAAAVEPLVWGAGADATRQWRIDAADDTQRLSHRIGGLAAGAAYDVVRAGTVVATVQADSTGTVTFVETPGSAPVDYALVPASSSSEEPPAEEPPAEETPEEDEPSGGGKPPWAGGPGGRS